MRRLALLLIVAAALPACKKVVSGPTVVATEVADDGGATLEIDFAYEAQGEREIELTLNMRAIGLEQMDKIVVQVEIGDFHIADGVARWAGFVRPRDPEKYVVGLVAVDGNDSPSLNIYVTRSQDSHMLMSRTLDFVVEGGKVIAVE